MSQATVTPRAILALSCTASVETVWSARVEMTDDATRIRELEAELAAASVREAAAAKVAADRDHALAEALRAQTASAAFAGFQEAKLGTLEPGKLADVVVLGEDRFRFPPGESSDLPVHLTISGGRIVHRCEA